jgi:hypothetical protein
MKTLHNKVKIAVGIICLAALMVSCVPEPESMGDAGQTLVKLVPGGFKIVPFNAAATAQSAVMFEVRRDPSSQGALNSSTTVILQKDDAIIEAYNEENETVYEPLPTSLATTVPAPAADGKVTLEFGPGEFAKGIVVNVPNATNFDFAKKYALAYKLVSVSGTGVKSLAVGDEVLVDVGVKNKYDGVYEVTALTPMLDVLNAALTGYYPFQYELQTSGANSCLCYDKTIWYDYMHPITNNGAASGYGSFGLEVFFDPSGSGNIVDVLNPWGNPPGNTRMPAIDPSGVNKWDEATGDIQFKYWMKQPSLVPDPPNIRVYFDEYWSYKGSR